MEVYENVADAPISNANRGASRVTTRASRTASPRRSVRRGGLAPHVPRRRRARCASALRAGRRRQPRRIPRPRARPRTGATAAPFAGILAGRDLAAGGTWLGVRRDGRWALVTNVRERGRHDPARRRAARSCRRSSTIASAPTSGARRRLRNARGYNGFNLLAGDARRRDVGVQSRRRARRAGAGIHGLSNALLDTPWPKLTRTRHAVAAWAASGGDDLSPLSPHWPTARRRPTTRLPATGVSLEWERLLSAPFIVSDDYGTRCSTVLAIDARAAARASSSARSTRSGDAVGEVGSSSTLRRKAAWQRASAAPRVHRPVRNARLEVFVADRRRSHGAHRTASRASAR